MNKQNQPIETLQDIKAMMDKSSRFISLSGLSGIAAGICALVGAWFASRELNDKGILNLQQERITKLEYNDVSMFQTFVGQKLFLIAVITFITAFVFAFLFTYLNSRKQGIPVWGTSARRLVWNVFLPMAAGAIFIFKLSEAGVFGFIAPVSLIFYGLALVNGGKFTLGEIRYLGYAIIVLGLVNCWFPGYGLYFWSAGFGFLHILYGLVMWNKYERI